MNNNRDVNNNITQQAKDLAIEMINASVSGIPVIYDIESSNIYQGIPLNYKSLTPGQKVAVVIYAIKKAIENDQIGYFDINELFYNLPSVNVHVVAKIPIGGKLLDVKIDFGVYSNMQINEYPNGGNQYGPLSGVVGNYSVSGYWYVWKFRSYGTKYGNGADALFLYVKEKGQYNYDNSDYFSNYMDF